MLFLIFKAGDNYYALDADRIMRIVPCVKLRPYPATPAYVAGILHFRGNPVVVADLSSLLNKTPAKRLMSTRIIVTEYKGRAGRKRQLGLMVEGATSVMKKDRLDHVENALKTPGTNYLGRMFRNGEHLVQFINPEQIIPGELENIMDVPEEKMATA